MQFHFVQEKTGYETEAKVDLCKSNQIFVDHQRDVYTPIWMRGVYCVT